MMKNVPPRGSSTESLDDCAAATLRYSTCWPGLDVTTYRERIVNQMGTRYEVGNSSWHTHFLSCCQCAVGAALFGIFCGILGLPCARHLGGVLL